AIDQVGAIDREDLSRARGRGGGCVLGLTRWRLFSGSVASIRHDRRGIGFVGRGVRNFARESVVRLGMDEGVVEALALVVGLLWGFLCCFKPCHDRWLGRCDVASVIRS